MTKTIPVAARSEGHFCNRVLVVCALFMGITVVRGAENEFARAVTESLRTKKAGVAASVAVGSSQPAAGQAAEVSARLAETLAAAKTTRAATTQKGAQLTAQNAKGDARIVLRPGNGTVLQFKGEALEEAAQGQVFALAGGRNEQTARQFLRRHREVLKLNDPDAELVLSSQEKDAFGQHLRFRQVYQGLPVWPAGLRVHLDAKGNVNLLDGAYAPTPDGLPVAPRITAEEAVRRAKAKLRDGGKTEADAPELIIYAPLEAASRLAWKFDLSRGLTEAWRFVVDAENGRVLHRSNRIHDGIANGTGVDLTGTSRTLRVWEQGGTYYLSDASKQMFQASFDPLQDPHGVITVSDARGLSIENLWGSDLFHVTSSSANLWDIPAGVSAAFNFSQTYDYFLERHARNSTDGQGGNITAVVRVGDYANASWHGNLRIMLFGDVEPYAACLDVVGHELAHGVTENSAGLIYENQSGALNEAFSDIFGEMVEARSRGTNDWLMGSELNEPIRNMKNPGALTIGGLNRPFPSKMSEFIRLPNTPDGDNGGVHLNSSIINHAFYLLAEGLPGAVGRQSAERIFYRALTQHLQAQSQFVDCRLACIASAEAIFGAGSTEANSTVAAFDAVEIFSAPPTEDPTPVPVVQGPDSTFFVYYDPVFDEFNLGRRETAQGDNEFGSIFALNVFPGRPAVSGDGAVALFVDAAWDICVVETADGNTRECLGLAGLVHSVAISPDQKYAAFVLRNAQTQEPEGQITIVNLDTTDSKSYNLVAPSHDGISIDAVVFADEMTFSTDSTTLIYDAISQVKVGSGPTLERWSIYGLNLATEQTSILVPPIEGYNTGNPSFGRAGNRYLAFDAVDAKTDAGSILVLDLFTGDVAAVGVVENGWGYPTFTGDESAVIFATPDDSAVDTGYSLYRQNLGSDRLTKDGDLALWYHDAALGVTYRRGAFSGTNALPTVSLSVTSTNATAPATITLTATAGDSDGSVAKVEFYNGVTKLGEASSEPFQFTWQNVPQGEHRVIARAVDNINGTTDSEGIVVRVLPGQGGAQSRLRAEWLPNRVVRLTIEGEPGDYIIEMSSNLREWTDIYPLTVGAGGTGTQDDSGGPQNEPVLFYRARKL